MFYWFSLNTVDSQIGVYEFWCWEWCPIIRRMVSQDPSPRPSPHHMTRPPFLCWKGHPSLHGANTTRAFVPKRSTVIAGCQDHQNIWFPNSPPSLRDAWSVRIFSMIRSTLIMQCTVHRNFCSTRSTLITWCLVCGNFSFPKVHIHLVLLIHGGQQEFFSSTRSKQWKFPLNFKNKDSSCWATSKILRWVV